MKSTQAQTMAPSTTFHSLRCSDSSGISTRMAAAAIANAPRMVPITEADRPRSCPRMGTTKVCTSQHDDRAQFISSRRRKPWCCSMSQAVPERGEVGVGSLACSATVRTHSQALSGSSAISRKAARKPVVLAASPPA